LGDLHMTMLHSTIATFSNSLSDIFAELSHAAVRHGEAKRHKTLVAQQIKALTALDPHLLDDIGLKGFHRLPLAEQERLLLRRSALGH
jgi:hypothetical protein